MIYLDTLTPLPIIEDYLRSKSWLLASERILSVEKPGEGNMNVVLRIKTDQRSFVLKQSRPYVQKYREIEAPLDRIEVEYRFYQSVRDRNPANPFPKIFGYEPNDFILLMEDLGQCEDMVSCYDTRTLSPGLQTQLLHTLNEIHLKTPPPDFLENMALRQLNHQHIFVLPFMEKNGFELDKVQPGLETLARPYKKDLALKKVVDSLGEKYLSKGNTLLHGDFYPGSWMFKEETVYIIDPEFSFLGFSEFDLGVMAAHLVMITMDTGYLEHVFYGYEGKADKKLTAQITGVEIMRRLIGLAQLPMCRSLDEKRLLLQNAKQLILS
ncbi:phosphotransferase [Flavobacteriaceae bacterium F89]|uniref:Phosphotransferase n=1 Tax=Cerina litoralis TaxID=2874477 RepID=A0AAE3ETH0_9FLAO|nr:phosphotransferase [Cerina litoralis]MCG2459904.1 phosphotransferase [Cerina litoralis]